MAIKFSVTRVSFGLKSLRVCGLIHKWRCDYISTSVELFIPLWLISQTVFRQSWAWRDLQTNLFFYEFFFIHYSITYVWLPFMRLKFTFSFSVITKVTGAWSESKIKWRVGMKSTVFSFRDLFFKIKLELVVWFSSSWNAQFQIYSTRTLPEFHFPTFLISFLAQLIKKLLVINFIVLLVFFRSAVTFFSFLLWRIKSH